MTVTCSCFSRLELVLTALDEPSQRELINTFIVHITYSLAGSEET